jgi:hypothetical protein
VARLPWINDTHREPNLRSLERVPITFFLTEPGEVSLAVKDDRDRTVWEKSVSGRRGFNQVRWDLVTRRVDSPRPYFTNYLQFARPGDYQVEVNGDGVELKGVLKIVERTEPFR